MSYTGQKIFTVTVIKTYVGPVAATSEAEALKWVGENLDDFTGDEGDVEISAYASSGEFDAEIPWNGENGDAPCSEYELDYQQYLTSEVCENTLSLFED